MFQVGLQLGPSAWMTEKKVLESFPDLLIERSCQSSELCSPAAICKPPWLIDKLISLWATGSQSSHQLISIHTTAYQRPLPPPVAPLQMYQLKWYTAQDCDKVIWIAILWSLCRLAWSLCSVMWLQKGHTSNVHRVAAPELALYAPLFSLLVEIPGHRYLIFSHIWYID